MSRLRSAARRTTASAPRPAQFVPAPETHRRPAGQLLDDRAAEHIFHDDVRVADFLRRRNAALRAETVCIEDAALLLTVRHRFGHTICDALSAIIAKRGDGEELVLWLKRDRFKTRFFREQVLRDEDLFNADEAFLTSTTRELLPITGVDERTIGSGKPGPVTSKLLQRFRERAWAGDWTQS